MDTYTLKIRTVGQFEHTIEIPEIGKTVTSASMDGALVEAKRAIEKHLTTRYLVLVFDVQHFDSKGWYIEPERRLSDLELHALYELEQLGFVPRSHRSERHLVLELAQPLSKEQARWLDESAGKLFERYYFVDEMEVGLEQLQRQAHENRSRLSSDE